MVPLASIRLIVEIAHSTADYDLVEKMQLHSRNGIPEYWVIDLDARRVHIFWSPAPTGFAERVVLDLGAQIAARTITALIIESDGLG